MDATETETTEAEAAGTPSGPLLSPEDRRRRPDVGGTATVLADGRGWLLADYMPELGGVWDKLYTDNRLSGAYDLPDLWLAASDLLRANYDVERAEAAWLIAHAEPEGILAAVEAALFDLGQTPFNLSHWIKVNLYLNGIDPAKLPPADLPIVLQALEKAKRVVPRQLLIACDVYRAHRADLLGGAT